MFCDKVREFLSHKKVEFTERDITRDDSAVEELAKLGILSTPVTVVDDTVIVGFDSRKLSAALELP